MARPCATCPPTRKQKLTASIHGKQAIIEGWGHKYEDKTTPGIPALSEGRRNYAASEAHRSAYEHVEGECIFFAGGAPNHVCFGGVTPGHIVSRTVAGSLEEADRWPVAPECARANTDVDADPELRKWAEEHWFMWHDGRLYRYRYDRPTFERELLNGYVSPASSLSALPTSEKKQRSME